MNINDQITTLLKKHGMAVSSQDIKKFNRARSLDNTLRDIRDNEDLAIRYRALAQACLVFRQQDFPLGDVKIDHLGCEDYTDEEVEWINASPEVVEFNLQLLLLANIYIIKRRPGSWLHLHITYDLMHLLSEETQETIMNSIVVYHGGWRHQPYERLVGDWSGTFTYTYANDHTRMRAIMQMEDIIIKQHCYEGTLPGSCKLTAFGYCHYLSALHRSDSEIAPYSDELKAQFATFLLGLAMSGIRLNDIACILVSKSLVNERTYSMLSAETKSQFGNILLADKISLESYTEKQLLALKLFLSDHEETEAILCRAKKLEEQIEKEQDYAEAMIRESNALSYKATAKREDALSALAF